MALKIVSYQPEHQEAVSAFNQRARAHAAPFELSASPLARWLPKCEGSPLYREFFLALEGAEVRGGFTLRRQDFWIGGETRPMANYQGPLSEGIWDRKFMMAGVQLLRAALREEPCLYALSMGGVAQPLPKQLAAAGWSLALAPFFFKVLRANAFLKNIQPLRRSPARRVLLDLGVGTGLGALAVHALQLSKSRNAPSLHGVSCERTSEFGPWADLVWEKARSSYHWSAIRDRRTQNVLFGDGNEKNMILVCRRGAVEIGWAVVRSTPMQRDKYFGDLRLGSLIDCLALPGEEAVVGRLATQFLKQLGSDLVISNQTHRHWTEALRRNGYLSGPSNFAVACSAKLTEALGNWPAALEGMHLTRSDGDGPIHL